MTIEAPINSVAPAGSQRSERRRVVHLLVEGTHRRGKRSYVHIRNISKQGLLLETDLPLAVDEEISVMLPVAGKVPAQVVWSSGSLFGCHFEKTLSSAALSAVRLQSPPLPANAVGERKSDGSDEPFHTRLVRLRKRAGMTIVDAAKAVGVNRLTVWNWEHGRARPRPARIAALAKALGVSEAVLLKGDENASEEDVVQAPMEVLSNLEGNVFEREETRFARSVSQPARLPQLIAASKDQIAALAGTTPDKITIIVEF